MVSAPHGVVYSAPVPAANWKRWLNKYFYFCASLLIAAIAISGFSQTVGRNLLYPALPRPIILWVHAAAFSAWIVFLIMQSALVRTGHVRWHRSLGWGGAALGA